MTIPTKGWAVQNPDGSINIRTVTDTERGAKVNWLAIVPRVMIYDYYTDGHINDLWERFCGEHVVKPIRVVSDAH